MSVRKEEESRYRKGFGRPPTRRSFNEIQILEGWPQAAEEEIAAAALFLVRGQASAITAQTPNVDGGTAFG